MQGAETNLTDDIVEITDRPLDVGAITESVKLEACGATVTLDGYVRRFTKGRETLYLVYEAYPTMAEKEIRKLIIDAKSKFEIARVAVHHRTGRLEIGETSVVIAVAAPHRKAAFEACEWLIRELKQKVPIWKKEVYSDGHKWIEGEK